jgi:hypothetical protein
MVVTSVWVAWMSVSGANPLTASVHLQDYQRLKVYLAPVVVSDGVVLRVYLRGLREGN